MATFTGSIGSVTVGGVVIGELTNFSINQSAETVDDTAKGDTWRSKKATFKTWSGSLTFRWDPSDSGQGAVVAGADLALVAYPTTNASGEKYYSGNAIITEIELSSELEALIETTVSFEGNGELAEDTVT